MTFKLIAAAALLAAPALAADAPPALSPGEIVAAAPASDWVAIAAEDLLVMTLAPDATGKSRQVFIQLVPPPFSQRWVANIRTLAKAHWWDDLAIVRAQDNYVVQWGDPEGEDAAKAKSLPEQMKPTVEADYTAPTSGLMTRAWTSMGRAPLDEVFSPIRSMTAGAQSFNLADPFASAYAFIGGFPVALGRGPGPLGSKASFAAASAWPVHCYGTVGVGRGLSPDAGSGAELYAVIGHAPRHLDRNIAVVGRVIEGIEHLSTLPRGTEALGFYATPAERTGIVSIRLASELPQSEQPKFEYLSTEGDAFARYADARANRKDEFFIVPAGGADICNIPVPVRRKP
jgi:peptidylprolyl isomerase